MEKTTTPSGSLHRGRNGRKKTFQGYIVAFPPPVQGGVRGGSQSAGFGRLESKI